MKTVPTYYLTLMLTLLMVAMPLKNALSSVADGFVSSVGQSHQMDDGSVMQMNDNAPCEQCEAEHSCVSSHCAFCSFTLSSLEIYSATFHFDTILLTILGQNIRRSSSFIFRPPRV